MRPSLKYARSVFGREPVLAVELGVCAGENAIDINNALNCERIVLVDLWHEKYNDHVFEWMQSTLNRFMDIKHSVMIRANAIFIYDIFKDNSIDYLYIDDSHSPEHVLNELCLYWPKIKRGGIISGHDYDDTRPDRVKKAVDIFVKENGLKLNVEDIDWWILKE
jgi:hypothetical protein